MKNLINDRGFGISRLNGSYSVRIELAEQRKGDFMEIIEKQCFDEERALYGRHNILVRAHSNSDELAKAFARGAEEAGNEVEIISLKGKNISYCTGCMACQKTQECVLKDDAVEIVGKIKNAHVLAFATPVYYYCLSGQLKTLLDRCNPLFPSDYTFRDL